MTTGNEFEYNDGSPFTLSNHDLSGIKNGSGKYPCDECEYQADGQVILRRHKQAKHDGVKIDCSFCDRSFSFQSNLNRHHKKVHAELK